MMSRGVCYVRHACRYVRKYLVRRLRTECAEIMKKENAIDDDDFPCPISIYVCINISETENPRDKQACKGRNEEGQKKKEKNLENGAARTRSLPFNLCEGHPRYRVADDS